VLARIPVIKFFGEGEMFEPANYLNKLQKAQAFAAIVKDRYMKLGPHLYDSVKFDKTS